MTAGEGQVGVADHPDPSAISNDRSATAGADRPPLPGDTPTEHLRNALTVLQAAAVSSLLDDVGAVTVYRSVDVQEIRRLVAHAIERLDAGRDITKKNLDRALATIRRLELAIAAPRPIAITRIMTPRFKVDALESIAEEAFLVLLSDGSCKRYWPERLEGERWESLEPVPSTRADVLQERVA